MAKQAVFTNNNVPFGTRWRFAAFTPQVQGRVRTGFVQLANFLVWTWDKLRGAVASVALNRARPAIQPKKSDAATKRVSVSRAGCLFSTEIKISLRCCSNALAVPGCGAQYLRQFASSMRVAQTGGTVRAGPLISEPWPQTGTPASKTVLPGRGRATPRHAPPCRERGDTL